MSGSEAASDGGIFVVEDRVRPEWIDINGHMNVAYYVLAFDLGVDALWSRVGITDDYIESRKMSTFAVESHITYQAELKSDDPYRVTTSVLAVDDKRVHQVQSMYHARDGYLAATAEWLNLHVNLATRRVCPWPQEILQSFLDLAASQRPAGIPDVVGKTMRIERPIYKIGQYDKKTNQRK